MPAGASPKREREYKKLVNEFRKEHRYPNREEEVAARIVNKQRREHGETKDQQQKDTAGGGSLDKNPPISDYQKLTVQQINSLLDTLTTREMRKIRSYELNHLHRKTVLASLTRHLSAGNT